MLIITKEGVIEQRFPIQGWDNPKEDLENYFHSQDIENIHHKDKWQIASFINFAIAQEHALIIAFDKDGRIACTHFQKE